MSHKKDSYYSQILIHLNFQFYIMHIFLIFKIGTSDIGL